MVVTRVVQDQSSWPPSKSKFINMLCVCEPRPDDSYTEKEILPARYEK